MNGGSFSLPPLRKCKMKVIYCLLFLPFYASAFHVDSMIKNADNEDYFIITGSDQRREYIYVTLSELVSDKDGKAQEVNYNANNVMEWAIVAEPSEVVVSSGEKVKVKIKKNYNNSGSDRVFGVTFTPDAINTKKNNDVDIPFGYKSWFIVPGKDEMHGDISVTKGKTSGEYNIHNNSNKVIDVRINHCQSQISTNCTSKMITRAWSNKKIKLESNVNNVEFKFILLADNSKKIIKRIIL